MIWQVSVDSAFVNFETNLRCYRWSLDRIKAVVCRDMGAGTRRELDWHRSPLNESGKHSRTTHAKSARMVIAFMGRQYGYRGTEIAAFLGVRPSTVSQLLWRNAIWNEKGAP